jgi:diacylglycerol kinase family enzyme
MQALVLLNPAAGIRRRAQPGDLAARVRDGLAVRGVEAEVRLTPGGAVVEAARAFIGADKGAGGRRLVVGGGDGTISAAASALAGSDVALGVLPLGTLNHFARDLRAPLDLDGAMDVVAADHVRSVDVGEVNGRVFINNSSIGLYPFLVAERTAEQQRRGIGKLAAIGPALLRSLRSPFWHKLRIVTEDARRELRTPCVFVGANFYDLAAFGRRDNLSSGELCIYVVKEQTRLGLALLPFKVALGLNRRERDIELLRARHCEISGRRASVTIAADGEVLAMTTPLHYRIRPGALRVLAPAAAP